MRKKLEELEMLKRHPAMYIAGLRDVATKSITTLEHASAHCIVMIAELNEFRYFEHGMTDQRGWLEDILEAGLHRLQEQLGHSYKDMNVLAEAFMIWRARKNSKGLSTDETKFLQAYLSLHQPSEEMVARVTVLVRAKESESQAADGS